MSDLEEILESLKETEQKIADWEAEEAAHKDKKVKTTPEISVKETVGIISELPSMYAVGIDNDLLHLCATISGSIYDAPTESAKGFEDLLKSIDGISKSFPDLNVRFLDKGATIPGVPSKLATKTPFTAIITGSTLILTWRGTYTFMDVIADVKFDSEAPWKDMKDLEVQAAFYAKVEKDLANHEKDVLNYVNGSYMKDKDKPITDNPDGTPITSIILTGHSLGGGLAQVAHVALKVPPAVDNKGSLASELDSKKVDIRTVAFAAPMSIALSMDDPESSAYKFLEGTVEPKMRNLFYNTDVVPRGYGDLNFINSFLNALVGGISSELAVKLVDSLKKMLAGEGVKQLSKYRHIGKLIYYDNSGSKPAVFVDGGFDGKGPKPGHGEKSFYASEYEVKEPVAETAMSNHMALVTGPGLAYEAS